MFIAKRNEQSGSFTQEKKKGEVDKFGFLFSHFMQSILNPSAFVSNLLLDFYLSQKYSISKLILLKNKSNCDEESAVWKSLKRKRLAHKGGMGQTKVESTQRRTAGQIKVLHWRRET